MPWLLLTTVGAVSAYLGSIVTNLSERDIYTPPASVGSSDINVTKILLYTAGGVGIFLLAKKGGLIK